MPAWCLLLDVLQRCSRDPHCTSLAASLLRARKGPSLPRAPTSPKSASFFKMEGVPGRVQVLCVE